MPPTPVATSVRITPGGLIPLAPATSVQLSGEVLDQYGNPMAGRTVFWFSPNVDPLTGFYSAPAMSGVLEDVVMAMDSEFTHVLGNVTVRIQDAQSAVRGDVNGNGSVEVTDIIFLMNWVFRGEVSPLYLKQGDCNADGITDVTDIVSLQNCVFRGDPLAP